MGQTIAFCRLSPGSRATPWSRPPPLHSIGGRASISFAVVQLLRVGRKVGLCFLLKTFPKQSVLEFVEGAVDHFLLAGRFEEGCQVSHTFLLHAPEACTAAYLSRPLATRVVGDRDLPPAEALLQDGDYRSG